MARIWGAYHISTASDGTGQLVVQGELGVLVRCIGISWGSVFMESGMSAACTSYYSSVDGAAHGVHCVVVIKLGGL